VDHAAADRQLENLTVIETQCWTAVWSAADAHHAEQRQLMTFLDQLMADGGSALRQS